VAEKATDAVGTLQQLPTDRLRAEIQKLLAAYVQHTIGRVGDKVTGLTGRLTDFAESGGPGLKAAIAGGKAASEGKSPLLGAVGSKLSGAKDKVKGALGGGNGDSGSAAKATNIVEYIDVGVPVEVAYNQWTEFQEFPSFMKKVEGVDQDEDTKLTWKAQVLWSHRTWESTIIDQEPEDHIVWKSSGAKGYVDGAVTFHKLAPNLTRILVVLEYHPQGIFEQTGNLWRAQGRRARLELKHFRRHVMTQTLLHPEDVEGWRGEIKDSEVTRPHEDAVADSDEGGSADEDRPDDEYDDEDTDEETDDEPEDDTDEYDDTEDDEEEEDTEDEPVKARRG